MTLDQQIDCAKRELKRRQSVLPKMVESGRFTEEKAAFEIELMAAIYRTLSQLKGLTSK